MVTQSCNLTLPVLVMQPAKPRFADPIPIAFATMALLATGVVMDLHRLSFLAAQRFSPETLMNLPHQGLHILVRLATIALFAMWVDRVWGNLPALGARPEQSRTLAVLSFFIPPLCFYRPVQIVHEVWAESAPDGAGNGRYFRLAVAWWVAFLIPLLLIVTGFGSDHAGKWLRMTAGEAFNVVAGLLGMAVVFLPSRQQRDASRRSPVAEVAPPPAPSALPVREGYVAARTATPPPPVPIAPAARTPAPTMRTAPVRPPVRPPALPVQRMIQRQHGSRPSIERAMERVSPRTWQMLLVAAGAVAAVALLASGAILIQTPRNLAPALLQLGFASLISAAAFSVSRQKTLPGEGGRWLMRSLAGVLVTLALLFSVAELLL